MRHWALWGAALAVLAGAPPAAAQAPGEASALPERVCLRECLIGHLRGVMQALAARDAARLPLAPGVLITENNVPLAPGEGLWRTVREVDSNGLEVADQTTGHAAWFGSVRENDHAAFYALRIRVAGGLITEMESVIHRRSGLPAPFGDWQNMEHFAEFYEVLPPEERRPRERLLAIADAYFDTVELNDGQVFAPFSQDCARLENGILTTAVRAGEQNSAAAIAAGCEEQFRLGIYRINKRIRRSLPLVDEERGIVVASGFFDHANEWDRYRLTDGREMRTALKWPNSITLLEAFRIRNAEIQRIEAVFTYVPYFMHNPFWGRAEAPPPPAARPDRCDEACLTRLAASVPAAMQGNNWATVTWANRVGYAENSVGIRVGEGIWATVTAIDPAPLLVADATTGRSVWLGWIEEHGQRALAAFAVAADGEAVAQVDATIRRREYGPPYEDATSLAPAPVLPAARRTPRHAMLDAAARLGAAMQANGPAPADLAASCRWHVNGSDRAACDAAFGGPALARVERVRDRQVLAVDEARGLLVQRLFEDIPATDGTGYPLTWQVIQLLRFDGGRIASVEAFTSELPYGMAPFLR